MSIRWLLRDDSLERALLCFAIGHVFSHGRIIAAQLEAVWVVLAILHCDIGMAALGAAQLNNDAVTFLTCHGAFLIALIGVIVAELSIYKLAAIVAANQRKDKRATTRWDK